MEYDANPGEGDEDYVRYYYNKDYQVLTETDENDTELRSFLYGNGLDEALVMMDPNGADYFYLKGKWGHSLFGSHPATAELQDHAVGFHALNSCRL